MIDSATWFFVTTWQTFLDGLNYVQAFFREVVECCILVFLLCLTLRCCHWLFCRYHMGCLRRCLQVKRREIQEMAVTCEQCKGTPWMSTRVHVPFGCEHVFCEDCVTKLMCKEWHNPCQGKFAACPVDKRSVRHGFSIFN